MSAAEREGKNNPAHLNGSTNTGLAATAARLALASEAGNREEGNRGNVAVGLAVAGEPLAGEAVAGLAVADPAAHAGVPATEVCARQKLIVLVVEDGPTDIELSLRALQQAGFDADSA